ncbi:MAG: zinc metalloprotease HtpX [Chloroflexi bacterium]|nr:zinc metalloprotease HtpX [Chloroflexota bacterium]
MHTGNLVKTTLLMAALTGFFLLIGGALGGTSGLVIALVFAVVMNLGMWWFSDSLALRFSGARELRADEAPQLHRLVATLAERANIPEPRVYLIESDMPNAFATGRSPQRGAVAVTTGIVELLSADELAGVIAHELAHIKNRDTLVASMAATMAGAISMVADMAMWSLIFGGGDEEDGAGGLVGGLLSIILAPIIALIIQMAISRSREYGADEGGARLLGDPEPLARALEKLDGWMHNLRQDEMPQVNTGTAHLYIVNPLVGGAMLNLFRTHPPTEERVARLRALAPALNWRQSRAVTQ